MITSQQLKEIYNIKGASTDTYAPLLCKYMQKYGINTTARICAFIAQIGHESGRLVYTEEIASGAAYEGRKDLGNTEKGDGVKYKGRGLIQITGRYNYDKLSADLQVDFINNPYQLSQPKWATESACWFWRKNNLNRFADSGDFKGLTKAINGGYNGLSDREEIWERAKKVLM